jgi:hypothetical protein
MALSALDDKTNRPDDQALKTVLGRTFARWQELQDHLSSLYKPLTSQWSFSGEKYGWSLRLIQKKRVIVYLIPQQGYFLAGLVLGDRAVKAARAAALPPGILAAINAAPRYGEGTGFRLEVRTKADVGSIEKLAAIKMAP